MFDRRRRGCGQTLLGTGPLRPNTASAALAQTMSTRRVFGQAPFRPDTSVANRWLEWPGWGSDYKRQTENNGFLLGTKPLRPNTASATLPVTAIQARHKKGSIADDVSSGHGVVFLGSCTLLLNVGSRRDHIGITVGSRTIIWDHVRFPYKTAKVLVGSRETSAPLYNIKGGVE